MNNIDHLDIDNNNNDNNNEVNEDNEVHIFNENTSRSGSTKSIFSSRTYSELISRDTINNNSNNTNNKMTTNFTAIDIDWYGNTSLHHAYALTEIDLKVIKNLLDLHPEYAKSKNQFGRLPLHYALDRSTVNIKGIIYTMTYCIIDFILYKCIHNYYYYHHHHHHLCYFCDEFIFYKCIHNYYHHHQYRNVIITIISLIIIIFIIVI